MRKEIIQFLNQNRLKEALTQMAACATHTSDWQLKNEIADLQTSYELMLQYTRQGMKDPGKEKLHHQMIQTAYELTDRIYLSVNAVKASGLYYETMRTFAIRPPRTFGKLRKQLEEHEETETDSRRHIEALDELFDKIWVSTLWTEAESREATGLLNSPALLPNHLAVMISAVTLSLLTVFDPRKLMLLISACTHPEGMVSQRAQVGIALTCYYHDQRIRLYPEIAECLDEILQYDVFADNLYELQIQLLQSARETRKADQKMQEIIPEMMKNPHLRRPRIGMDETEEAEDRNPEWEEWIDRTGITDKLRELGELHLAGIDVYMSTFAQLKHYPFFHKIAHWFYPFDPHYPDVAKLHATPQKEGLSLMDLLLRSDAFCSSDKYSLSLTLSQMPGGQLEQLQQHLFNPHELNEELKEHITEQMSPKNGNTSGTRQYIQDIYRFFKLWMRRHEFHDIFNDRLDLWKTQTLSSVLLAPSRIVRLADYLFTHGYLEEAGELYHQAMTQHDPQNAELWQKTGYIHQKGGAYSQAIDCYLQADLLDPDKTWNNRHLAQCYRKEGRYEKAIEYYQKVEQVQPDNLSIASQIGQCLMMLERYDEAMTYFFKVEYLDPHPQNARRALGWCSFLTGKHAEAKRYYDQLTAEPHPLLEDWMNAAHVYYVSGNTSQAIDYYQKAQSLCDSHNEFVRLFLLDKKVLLKQGMDETDFLILPDELL